MMTFLDKLRVFFIKSSIQNYFIDYIKDKLPSRVRAAFEDRSPGLNHFDKLPDEVVLNIFGRLPKNELENVAHVCFRFNRLSDDLRLWRAVVTLNLTGQILTLTHLRKIMKRKIKNLILREAEIQCLPRALADDPSFQLLHLTHLDLTHADFLQKTLTVLFGKCKNLKKLSATDVGDDALLALADANQDLEYLSLSFWYGTTGQGIEALLKNCRKLKEFEFTHTELTPEALSIICRNLPASLERVTVLALRNSEDLHDNLQGIFENCPKIVSINVTLPWIPETSRKTVTSLSLRRRHFTPKFNISLLSRGNHFPQLINFEHYAVEVFENDIYVIFCDTVQIHFFHTWQHE